MALEPPDVETCVYERNFLTMEQPSSYRALCSVKTSYPCLTSFQPFAVPFNSGVLLQPCCQTLIDTDLCAPHEGSSGSGGRGRPRSRCRQTGKELSLGRGEPRRRGEPASDFVTVQWFAGRLGANRTLHNASLPRRRCPLRLVSSRDPAQRLDRRPATL